MSGALFPCRLNSRPLWRIWHAVVKVLLWRWMQRKGIRHGLDWRNCPGCRSTLCKRAP